MTFLEIIQMCRVLSREQTRFSDQDWRTYINASMADFQKQTHILEAEIQVPLAPGVRVYDVRAVGAYRFTKNGRIGTTMIARVKMGDSVLDSVDLDQAGDPQYVYWVGTGKLALYPVPTASSEGDVLIIPANYFNTPLTASSSLDASPDFEEGDHPTIAYGAVVQAEITETDYAGSDRIRQLYLDGVMSARARRNNRMPNSRHMTNG